MKAPEKAEVDVTVKWHEVTAAPIEHTMAEIRDVQPMLLPRAASITIEALARRVITDADRIFGLEDAERLLANGGLHNFTITMVVAPDTLPTTPPADSDGTVVVAYLGNGPTGPANAVLIAAMPGLLTACETLIDAADRGLDADALARALAGIRVAAAKARGGA